MIKKYIFLFLIAAFLLTFPVFAQKTGPAGKKTATKTAAAKTETEKEAYEKALAQTDLNAKVKALKGFVQKYPNSENKNRALEVAVSATAQLADEKLRAGEKEAALELFKQAVATAPNPISEELFTKVILQFPTNLFYGGDQAGAAEIAKSIEEKVKDKPRQFLGLATFYLGTENAPDARRMAEQAIALDAGLAAAYQTLGLAHRLNFQLEESAAAYAKALELDPASSVSKRSLAEMKRALGKSDEAVALYRQILEKDAGDGAANNGLILALFNAGKKAEAEEKLNKSLETNPSNLPLLVGAAYWYAANNQGEKAVEFAQKAIAVEPRYTWAHIAMARGLAAQNRPLDAEKSLLLAKQFGNFPTLDYELASVRMSAGLFQEAAEQLRKSFMVRDGVIETKLANRVPKQADNFIELLELERRASIFEPQAADSLENAEKIKSLLTLNQTISNAAATAEQLNQSIENFTKGADKMKTHRQLYVANKLLQEKKNLAKAYELSQNAVSGVDESLTVNAAASAVLADELFDSRTIAISRGEVLVIPEVPRQTLSAVLRGRIEDIAGWSLYQQGKTAESVVRLKRAVSILPEKSSFWRASMWRLGAALDADGNTKDALEAYIKSYTSGAPDLVRRSVIEGAYRKVNGSLAGLDDKIGARPEGSVAQIPNTPDEPSPETIASASPQPAQTPETVQTPPPAPIVENSPTPIVEITPTPAPTVSLSPAAMATPEFPAEAKPEISPSPAPSVEKTASPETTQSSNQPTDTEEKSAKRVEEPKPLQNNAAKAEKEKITAERPETKSPFEPIIISVPKANEVKPNKETPPETEPSTENKTAKIPPKTEENSAEKDLRPRVFIQDTLTGKTTVELPSCLVVSQENISIINNGGNLGVLVGYTGEGDISQIRAASGSAEDVEITRDPEIGKMSNRVFFVIKSISSKTGEIPVVISAPCGKKEIRVIVR